VETPNVRNNYSMGWGAKLKHEAKAVVRPHPCPLPGGEGEKRTVTLTPALSQGERGKS